MNSMRFTGTVMKNLFSKPATRLYPQEERIYPERTRGKVAIDVDNCLFCGMCARKCPTGAITVNREEKKWDIERFNCVQCGCCVKNCPKKCLSMEQHYPEPAAKKYDDSFQKIEPPKEETPAPAVTSAPTKAQA